MLHFMKYSVYHHVIIIGMNINQNTYFVLNKIHVKMLLMMIMTHYLILIQLIMNVLKNVVLWLGVSNTGFIMMDFKELVLKQLIVHSLEIRMELQ